MVYYPDDFCIFSGNIQSTEPMTIELQGADVADNLTDALCIKLRWYDNLTTHHKVVKLVSTQGNIITLETINDLGTTENDSHFIQFKEYFEIMKTDESQNGELRYRIDKLNNRFRSTLSNQIKKIITDESLTNQYMFKMLMKIDSKLDELLDSIKEDDSLEGLEDMRTLGLGGAGLSFIFTKCAVSVGDTIYVQSMPKNGSGLNFAALCNVTDVISYSGRCICEADFTHIDESTREGIIHYIFQREREALKRNRT